MKGFADINDVTNRPMKRRKKPVPPCVAEVRRLIAQNKFDPSNPTHAHMRNVAIRHGELLEEEDPECQE